MHKAPWSRLLLALVCVLFLPASSCPIDDITKVVDRSTDKAVAELDKAINTLDRQSSSWQVTLTQLQQQLTADLQSTLANEVQNVLGRGIAMASLSLKCSTDFVGDRMKEELQALRAQLLKQPVPPRAPHFCEVVPDHVDLANRRATNDLLNFYGYDMDLSQPQKVKVVLVDTAGVEREVSSTYITTPSSYLLTVNISSNGVPFPTDTQQMRLRWNDKLLGSVAVTAGPAAPSCTDRVKNGNETDVDCGGGCPACARGMLCGNNSDCTGSACIGGRCRIWVLLGGSSANLGGIGGGGGNPFSASCGGGNVAIGLGGRAGTEVDALKLLCSSLRADGSLIPAGETPQFGGGGGTPFGVACPPGQVLVGLNGRGGDRVDQIGGWCAPLTGLSGGPTSNIGPFGGSGGGPFSRPCPGGYVVTGINGRSGSRLDQINFTCTQVVVQ